MSVETAARELWYVLQVETSDPAEAARGLARALAELTPQVEVERIIDMLSEEVGMFNAAQMEIEKPLPEVIYLPTYRPKERGHVVKCRIGKAR